MARLFNVLKEKMLPQHKKQALKLVEKVPDGLEALEPYAGFSDEFKVAFIKQADAISMPRDKVRETFSFLDKSMVCEKRGEYIHWLNTIHSN